MLTNYRQLPSNDLPRMLKVQHSSAYIFGGRPLAVGSAATKEKCLVAVWMIPPVNIFFQQKTVHVKQDLLNYIKFRGV